MKFIFGPLGIVIGILIMKYTVAVTGFTGKIDFAQKIFGAPFAGTYTYWRLFGLGLVILSILWMAGVVDIFGPYSGVIPQG